MDTHELPSMRGPDGPGSGGAPKSAAPPEPREEPAAETVRDASRQVIEPLMALDFSVHTSTRYHGKRRAWLDSLHRLALAVVALGASAAAAALYGGLYDAATDLTLAVAIAAALDLFFSFSDRA